MTGAEVPGTLRSLVWDEGIGRWRRNEDLGFESPILILTDKGKHYISDILRSAK